MTIYKNIGIILPQKIKEAFLDIKKFIREQFVNVIHHFNHRCRHSRHLWFKYLCTQIFVKKSV